MSNQKNFLWFSFGNIVYLGIQWLITILVTRSSGLNDAGILSLAMSISAVFQTIAFFGMRNYQISDIEEKYSNSLYIYSRIISCSLALIFCIFFVLSNHYQSNQSVAILLFMCFRISEAFSDVFHGILQKNNHLDLAGKGYLCKAIIIIIFFEAGYFFFNSLNFALFCMATGAVLSTMLYDAKNAKKTSSLEMDLRPKIECIALLKETAPLCLGLYLQYVILNTPKYILEMMCGEVALGAYSSVFAPAMLIQMATIYIFFPFTGDFSKYYQNCEVDKFKKLFLNILLCIFLVGVIAVYCGKLFGGKLLSIIFGAVISGYEYLLIPILFCVFTNAILVFYCMLSVVVRDFLGQIISCLVGFVACTISTVICISHFGINGASYGLIIGTLFAIFILNIRIVWKFLKLINNRDKVQ